MKPLRAAAAALLTAMLAGCAGLWGEPAAKPEDEPAATAAAAPAAAAASAPSPSSGVAVDIEAPAALRTLLRRHLDLIRLGRMERNEVEDSEWARLIDAAPAQARELLQTEGFFLAQVTAEREPGQAAGEPVRVRLRVTPGPRARVSRVTLESEGELERNASAGDARAQAFLESWRGAWTMDTGTAFRNGDWSDAKAAALTRLRAAGYANASWVGTGAEVDVPSNTVRLFLVADSGPLYRYGELEIQGLVVHDTDTVRHLAGAPAGAPVTEALVLDFQERLQRSGLFDSVNVTLDPDPTRADHARLLVRLREAPLQVYTFGVGVSANTGPRLTVEHTYRRVFGLAASSRNKVEWGQKRQFWEGEISTHPGEGMYRNLVGGTVENLESPSDTVLAQRLRLGRTQDSQRLERLYFVEGERSERTTVDHDRTVALALSVNYHGVWRRLDNVILPTEGYTLAGQIGLGRSHGTNADNGLFSRTYARLTGYLPLGKAWYGQARVELGQVFVGNNVLVPDSQKFRAGGDDSVRGYAYRSLGPLVGGAVGSGDALFTGSLELARPLSKSMPSLWGAVFVDAGNVANSFATLTPVIGFGTGLRWRSPVGPLRVDLAWGRETKKLRVHFSVGIAL